MYCEERKSDLEAPPGCKNRPIDAMQRITDIRVFLALALLACACSKQSNENLPKVTIGIVGKSQSNPVFQAAYTGAKAAAKELGAKRKLQIVIDWRTPPDENPQKQAEAIEALAREGVKGIAVSCSDAKACTSAIDKAVDLGAQVFCFDSDAPASKRFAYYGADDAACGRAVMQQLAKVMGERGTIAILAGNQSAPNLQARVQGVKEELAKHPDITLLADGVFYHAETPEQAAETVARAQSMHPEIVGWAMIGGWPLFTRGALRWQPGQVHVVAVDALPSQIDYLSSGHADRLLAQDCYGWGYKSVEYLLDKILDGKDPAGAPVIVDPLQIVTREDANAVQAKWKEWLATAR